MTMKVKKNFKNKINNAVNKNKIQKKNLKKNKIVKRKNGTIQESFKEQMLKTNEKLKQSKDEEGEDNLIESDEMEITDADEGSDDAGCEDEEASNTTEEEKIQEKQIKKKFNKERGVFVQNITSKISEADIKELFKGINGGEVESVIFKTTYLEDIKKNNHSQQAHIEKYGKIACVLFTSEKAAQNAINLNGKLFANRHIHIKCQKPETKSEKEELNNSSIMIGNLDFGADEEQVYELFRKYGEINYVKLGRNIRGGSGYGFINFKTPETVKVVLAQKNLEFGGRILRLNKAISLKHT